MFWERVWGWGWEQDRGSNNGGDRIGLLVGMRQSGSSTGTYRRERAAAGDSLLNWRYKDENAAFYTCWVVRISFEESVN